GVGRTTGAPHEQMYTYSLSMGFPLRSARMSPAFAGNHGCMAFEAERLRRSRRRPWGSTECPEPEDHEAMPTVMSVSPNATGLLLRDLLP
ncbi:MAG: hypothetical protein OEY86_18570, partial [Nitrospira sp.]|nr:hypothetical protein [Nitrospira sp.]